MDETSGNTSGELLSGRRAADLLAWAGLGERQARQVLAAGLAGTPLRAAGVVFYSAAVERLTQARVVLESELASVCPRGCSCSTGSPRTATCRPWSPWGHS